MPNENSGKDLHIIESHFYVRSLEALHGEICVTKSQHESKCFCHLSFSGHLSINNCNTVTEKKPGNEISVKLHMCTYRYTAQKHARPPLPLGMYWVYIGNEINPAINLRFQCLPSKFPGWWECTFWSSGRWWGFYRKVFDLHI